MVSVGSRLLTLVAATTFAAALYGAPAEAQTGRITGVVRDFRGVALTGAAVVVTNQATGASSRATSATDGRYTISGLAPGAYTISASVLGLRRMVQENVRIEAGATVNIDFALQPLTLDAITVTAMLREQELIDVPFSVAAPTEQALRLRGVENIEAIASNVAGFSVQNLGPGQSQVAMRGTSSGQIARDQPGVKEQVGAYLDDTPISLSLYTPDLDLFDVSRVEVLRGPQGTLFGAGSLSGTVRYISNQPALGVSNVFGEVGGSWIDGGSPGSNAKLGFNVPIGDKAAFRVAAYSNGLGGWMDAVQPDLTVNNDVNGGTRIGGRAAVRIVPSDRFSITPRVIYQRVKMDGWNRIDDYNILANPFTTTRPAVDLSERQLFTQIAEPYTDEFFLGDLTWQYDLGGITLTSTSSYTDRDILVVRDATALTGSITGGTIGLAENIYTLDAPLDDATRAKVWTQEVRLSGATDRLRWLVGGFYSNNKRDYGQSLVVRGFSDLSGFATGPGTDSLAAVDELFFSDLAYQLKQFAAFGEATLAVGPRLDLTAGVRYYNFNEEREQVFDGFFVGFVSQPGKADANGVAPRFIASYKLSDALTVNALASRGFRLGGINDPLNLPLCTPEDSTVFSGRDSWKDETAWNYEVGVKSRLAGGRASVNVSAFYMDISDLQLTVTAGSCSSRLIFNAPARSQGLEVEITASPSPNLDLSLAAGLNDSELTETQRDGAGNVLAGMAKGNRLPSVPKIQVTGAATYQWQLAPGSRAFISGSFQHTGDRYTAIDDQGGGFCPPAQPGCPFGTVDLLSFERGGGGTIGGPLSDTLFTFNPLLPSYSVVNLRVGLIREGWELAIFVNNVTDERAFLGLDRERGSRARVGYLTNQPRTGGVALRFAY